MDLKFMVIALLEAASELIKSGWYAHTRTHLFPVQGALIACVVMLAMNKSLTARCQSLHYR